MKRMPLSWRTKRFVLERDNYTCVDCGFTKTKTSSDIPEPFKTDYLMFVTFESIINKDCLARVLSKIDNGGDVKDIVYNWQDSERLEIDHILAVCNGGDNDVSNLQCLCKGCHRIKTNNDLAIYSNKQYESLFSNF